MKPSLFQGQLVRLAAFEVEAAAEAFARWSRDSEYARLLDGRPSRPRSRQQSQADIEQELARQATNNISFLVHTLIDDRLIGRVELDGIRWPHGDAFMGIGIGERAYRGKGYGTDALRLLLRYAFAELNLHRVSLNVFEYNPRAIRLYEKIGFSIEGRQRQALHRDGRHWDMIYMGLLRTEWEKLTDLDGKAKA